MNYAPFRAFSLGMPLGSPPNSSKEGGPCAAFSHIICLMQKIVGYNLKWEEHEKIAILESQFWKDQILWVLKCLQNYKVCIEKNCCSFKFIDICPEILLLSCLAISRPFPSSPPSADTWIPSESGSRCRVLIPVFFRCQDWFITN